MVIWEKVLSNRVYISMTCSIFFDLQNWFSSPLNICISSVVRPHVQCSNPVVGLCIYLQLTWTEPFGVAPMHGTEPWERHVWHAAHAVGGARHAGRVPTRVPFALWRRHARAVLGGTHVYLGDAAAVVVAVATADEQVAGEIAVGLDRTHAVDRLALRRVWDSSHHARTMAPSYTMYSCDYEEDEDVFIRLHMQNMQ